MRENPYKPIDFNDFWQSRVEAWMLEGVKDCVKNKINIGAMTLIFCYIDFFGSISKPKLETRQRFYYFLENYLGKIDPRYSTFKCMLYENFRCGLVHEFVMKKGAGIFRGDDKNDAGYEHFGIHNDALFLDVLKLKNDFITSVNKLKEDLDGNIECKKIAINYLRDELRWSLPEENIKK
jgi:hypothetical protein